MQYYFAYGSNLHHAQMKKRCPKCRYINSKCAERRLDIYEEYPTLYKKKYFKHNGKKVMTYTMRKKTKLVPPTTRYLNIIKQGYRDCKLNIKSLNIALLKLNLPYPR